MEKNGTRAACAMFAISMIASLPLGAVILWRTGTTLPLVLMPISIYALFVSLVIGVGSFNCKVREGRWEPYCVCLTASAAVAAMGAVAADPKGAPDAVALAVRLLVFSTYVPICRLVASALCRHMGRRLGVVTGVAIHALTALFVAYDPSCARGICVSHVVWMSLCWALFAFPVFAKPLLNGVDSRGAATLVVACFVVSFLSIATLDPLATFRLPGAVARVVAKVAMRPDLALGRLQSAVESLTRSWRDAAAASRGDSSVVACWLFLAFLVVASAVSCWVLWQDARRGKDRRMEEVLALGVLLSNVWGLACVVLHIDTGVGILLFGNPFQLVQVACLLVLEYSHRNLRARPAYQVPGPRLLLDLKRERKRHATYAAHVKHGDHGVDDHAYDHECC